MPKSKPAPRPTKKQHLPVKPCACCGKPMTWRKRWSRVWETVKFCSEKCRRQTNKGDD